MNRTTHIARARHAISMGVFFVLTVWPRACPAVVPPEESPAKGDEAIKQFYAEAKEYHIHIQGEEDAPLKLIGAPLLKWTNPARLNENGICVLWLRNGRPHVLGTIFTYQFRKVYKKHELVSLSEQKLTGRFRGHRVWNPGVPGVRFADVPGAAPPSAERRRRALEMRRLARGFTAQMTKPDKPPTALRLVPQPLYRYEQVEGDLIDGGLFSFALGTDPEALLVLEARREKGVPRWKYAFARLHYWELSAEHGGREVWRAKLVRELGGNVTGQAHFMRQSYLNFYPSVLPARPAGDAGK